MQAENVNILCNFGVTEPRRYEAQILPFPNALAAVIGMGGLLLPLCEIFLEF